MLSRLNEVEKRYEEVMTRLYDPSVTADPDRYRELIKESRYLEPIVEKYREYRKAQQQEQDALLILEEETDSDLRSLADAELKEAKITVSQCAEDLKILLLPRDPNDDRNVIVEIRAGAGGEESALFAASLYRMYGLYAQTRHYQTELLNVNETELGGYKEISFMVTGEGAYSRMKF